MSNYDPSASIYDGWNPVREIRVQGSVVSTNYFCWGPDLSGSMQGAGGVGGLQAVIVGGETPAIYYPCYDANGNITAYVDDLGFARAEYAYDAFGNTISQSGDLASTFSHRFSTKYADDETGLYYYGYRFYAPEHGRWVNRDPISESGGVNVYGFVENDVLNASDQYGLLRMITGALTFVRGKTGDHPGYAYARFLIRFLDQLNAMHDSKGRKCYNAKIKDFVTTPVKDVKSEVEKNADNVYLVAHAGLTVNGKIWTKRAYQWNNKDTVIEGFDIKHDGSALTPLSEFGEKLNSQNIFGCYISEKVRRKKVPGTWNTKISQRDEYDQMFIALIYRLLRYKEIKECPCETTISIYEGERSKSTLTTEETLKKYPIRPEKEYTGDQYDDITEDNIKKYY